RSVRILNSNRMTELGHVLQDDPVELAMSPDLDLLAVTNRATDTVDFIGIDPRVRGHVLSAPGRSHRGRTFHAVVHSTRVGRLPLGIAWDPGDEDILVCNEGEGSVSILSASTLAVRKTLTGLVRPFAVAITPRQDRFGLQRNVYFAYILQRDGRVAVFESG